MKLEFAQQILPKIEQTLENSICGDSVIEQAMRHILLGDGKRFRALLVYSSAQLLGKQDESIFPLCAAVELVHAYSLVHDDLPAMDNATLRRGKKTLHLAFDEATAILAGDALLTLAFQVISEHRDLSAQDRIEMIQALSRASGYRGMILGQMLDLEADITEIEQLEHLDLHKTGALMVASLELGGIYAGASCTQMQALQTFGAYLGQAFQMQDDLLDVCGNSAEIGKDIDLDAKKTTWVSLLGAQETRNRLHHCVATAKKCLEPFTETQDLYALLELASDRVK